MKTICIDARMWGVKHTGIGRYIEELINNLPHVPEVKIILIVPPDLKEEPKLKKFDKYYAKYHPYTLKSQFEMVFILSKIKPDLIHIPHFTIPVFWPGIIVITIHDLIKHYSVGSLASTHIPIVYWIKYFLYLAFMWFAVKRVNHIIVPAKYWKDILVAKYNLRPSKITVTYEGVSEVFSNSGIDNSSFNIRNSKYILYVGNLYPHKNIPVLLSAIKLLKDKVSLKIVCSRDIFRQRLNLEIQKQNISEKIEFLNQISDRELNLLYKHSLVFVTPALIEGFGLPGLEAMAVGTPVIAAKASCLPEIYQDAALFFDPYDSKDLAVKINSLLGSENMRENYIKKGTEQVKKYSWSKMANNTWQIYLNELR